jgi:hypothetical protein
MVAKITFPHRVRDALNYNEQKVNKGVADFLSANVYLQKPGDLNFYQKLEGLELRNTLNDRATTKTLHVSLNFSPEDKGLDTSTLLRIARQYMEGIDFGGQPYLVYCHRDAGHPHLHIVSTTIRPDGSRIATHNLGRDKSSKVRVAIEQAFGLTPAMGRKPAVPTFTLQVPQQARYGKEETKAAIARVVSHVFLQYSFGSLPEYNAALCAFGVLADRGKEGSRTYLHGGLVYRILNEQGQKKGVPIKASKLPGKPTLNALQLKFMSGATKKQPGKTTLMLKVDSALAQSKTFEDFTKALEQKDVFTLPRRSKEGNMYGITYVDHQSRCVFNGSELGKTYSAAALTSRLNGGIPEAKRGAPVLYNGGKQVVNHTSQSLHQEQHPLNFLKNTSALENLLFPPLQAADTAPPSALIKRRKRKGKRNLNM